VRSAPEVEGLLRELAPQALAALVRRYGDFGAAEDAVQEALLAAALQWPQLGVPDSPRGWLIAVAARRLIDWRRRESARRSKEAAAADFVPAQAAALAGPGDEPVPDRDDTLALLFLCCHPALAWPAQVALTLRAVGGLTTAEIAAAFLVPEATMAQRIRPSTASNLLACRSDYPPARNGPNGSAPCCTFSISSSTKATPAASAHSYSDSSYRMRPYA